MRFFFFWQENARSFEMLHFLWTILLKKGHKKCCKVGPREKHLTAGGLKWENSTAGVAAMLGRWHSKILNYLLVHTISHFPAPVHPHLPSFLFFHGFLAPRQHFDYMVPLPHPWSSFFCPVPSPALSCIFNPAQLQNAKTSKVFSVNWIIE